MQTQSKKTNIRKSIDEREPQEIDKNRQKRQREARNALASGKKYLSESKNLKSEIKEGVTAAIDVLYQKVKEAECENEQLRRTLLDGKETEVKCSHCGGQHTQAECDLKKAGETPRCINCTRLDSRETAHNAFSACCPVRRKWDSIARARVAYN
ncbi:hypothetical protein ACJJTC_011470 [Scirpophaga incertulas]